MGSRGRRSLDVAAAAAVLICACTAASSQPPLAHALRPAAHAQPRPNIVVILSDDERFDSLARMPNVRRLLGGHGVTFTNAFVTTSECCPSRASILSGEYSHHTGVIQNFGPAGYKRFDQRSNLATWLHDAGYDTALVGKYLNDYTIYGHHRIPPGWSNWRAIDSQPEERYYDYTLNENGSSSATARRRGTTRPTCSPARRRRSSATRAGRSSSTSRRSRRTSPRSPRRATSRSR